MIEPLHPPQPVLAYMNFPSRLQNMSLIKRVRCKRPNVNVSLVKLYLFSNMQQLYSLFILLWNISSGNNLEEKIIPKQEGGLIAEILRISWRNFSSVYNVFIDKEMFTMHLWTYVRIVQYVTDVKSKARWLSTVIKEEVITGVKDSRAAAIISDKENRK